MTEKNIQISKLKKGQHILLETKECVFDIEIVSPEKAVVFISGGRRFAKPTEAIVIGVYGRRNTDDDDILLVEKEIEKHIGLELQYNDKDNITSNFVTSPVLSAKVYGEKWAFEVWDANEKDQKLEKALDEARARLRIKTESKEDTDSNENTLS
jgi:hypothetical protein